MSQFTVPQFIEQKPKIVGPLNFQQFTYMGTAGGVCFILYFLIPFVFFAAAAIFIFSFAIILAFGRIGGRPLPLVFKNFLAFKARAKIYLWKKKSGPPLKLIQTKIPEPAEPERGPVPAISGQSRLGELSKQIETRKK